MMTGAYFLFNQLTTQASVFVSIHVYASLGFNHLPAQVLWTSAVSISVAWALTYVARAREKHTPKNTHQDQHLPFTSNAGLSSLRA
jgi:hypothetical protein